MNLKQKRFAEYYIQYGNAEKAAIMAGYSEKYARGNAHKLVAISCIAKYIKNIVETESNERIMTAKQRQIFLSDFIRNENIAVIDRLRAIDILNRMTGAYQVKIHATVEQSSKLADVMDQIGGEGLMD